MEGLTPKTPETPPWFKAPVSASDAEGVSISATPERSPALKSILDVLNSEADIEKVVELSDMLREWRDSITNKNGGNPFIAQEYIRDYIESLRAKHLSVELDTVLLFHLISGSTVGESNLEKPYILDIPNETTEPEDEESKTTEPGVIESEIRRLLESVK